MQEYHITLPMVGIVHVSRPNALVLPIRCYIHLNHMLLMTSILTLLWNVLNVGLCMCFYMIINNYLTINRMPSVTRGIGIDQPLVHLTSFII